MRNERGQNLIICPDCQNNLDWTGKKATCVSCGKFFQVKNGIPNFSSHDFYWNQIPRDQMKHIIKRAKEIGWKESLLESNYSDKPFMDYISSPSRADWLFYLPLGKNSKVLDIGCGWGMCSIQLSKWCGKLYSVDSTLETLDFLNVRAEQEGISNIETLAVDPLDYQNLPFAEKSLDLIVLNGVLEWVGSSNDETNPLTLQINTLKYLRTLLKPGGFLYIGIENRFSYRLLSGYPVHDELPFISVLPRFLAQFLTKVIRNQNHRTYIHSKNSYRKILSDCGFSNIDFFWPRSNYRFPDQIIPLDFENILRYWAKYIVPNSNLRQKLFKFIFTKFPNLVVFMTTFSITARK